MALSNAKPKFFGSIREYEAYMRGEILPTQSPEKPRKAGDKVKRRCR